MLGTAGRGTDKLRAENEALRDGMDRIKATLASLDHAAPEIRDGRLHSLVNVCRQVVGK